MKLIERTTLWDQAYHALRDGLLEGRFAPGDRILLRDVAGELGISLTPVRDAVNRLVAEHVLERGFGGQGGGAVVPRMAVPHFAELLAIRGDLEGRATARAAEVATAADVAALTSLLDEMRALIAGDKLDSYLAAHRRFHFRLYGMSKLPVLSGFIENLWLRCGPVLTYVVPAYVRLLKGTDFHQAALQALSRQDPDGAASAIQRDIMEAGQYISTLAGPNGWIRPPA